MTLTATYLSDLSRVRVAFTSAPAGADYALIERSTDGVNWTTLRGGANVPINAGAGKIDDYEFPAGKLTTYRASYIDAADITQVGSGTSATANNAAVSPSIPVGTTDGDLMTVWASIRNSGAGTVNTPAGWTKLLDFGNTALLARKFVAGDTAPSITFAGGVANADTIAQMVTWRNADIALTSSNTQLNASAQNIATPALTIAAGALALCFAWKQDDWSGINPITAFTMVAGPVSTAGDDAGQAYTFKLPAASSYVAGADSMVVTGGAGAISRAVIVSIAKRPYVSRETQTITPTPLGIWFKSITRPSLNQQVTVTDFSDLARGSRSAFFEVVNRTMPIANTDLMGSQRLTLVCTTPDKGEELKLDNMLAAGDVFFIQAPSDACPIPTMYAVIDGDMARSKHSKRTARRYFDIPVREVAAPSNLITGDTVLWSDIIATYATWQDLLNAKATWSDVIDSVATSVVIVP